MTTQRARIPTPNPHHNNNQETPPLSNTSTSTSTSTAPINTVSPVSFPVTISEEAKGKRRAKAKGKWKWKGKAKSKDTSASTSNSSRATKDEEDEEHKVSVTAIEDVNSSLFTNLKADKKQELEVIVSVSLLKSNTMVICGLAQPFNTTILGSWIDLLPSTASPVEMTFNVALPWSSLTLNIKILIRRPVDYTPSIRTSAVENPVILTSAEADPATAEADPITAEAFPWSFVTNTNTLVRRPVYNTPPIPTSAEAAGPDSIDHSSSASAH